MARYFPCSERNLEDLLDPCLIIPIEERNENYYFYGSGSADPKLEFWNQGLKADDYINKNNTDFNSDESTSLNTNESNNRSYSMESFETIVSNIYSTPLSDLYNNNQQSYLSFFSIENRAYDENIQSNAFTYHLKYGDIIAANCNKPMNENCEHNKNNIQNCQSLNHNFCLELKDMEKSNELIKPRFVFKTERFNEQAVEKLDKRKYKWDLIFRKIITNCLSYLSSLIGEKNLFSKAIKEGKKDFHIKFNDEFIGTILDEALKKKKGINLQDLVETISLRENENRIFYSNLFQKTFKEFFNQDYLKSDFYKRKLGKIMEKNKNDILYINLFTDYSENYIAIYEKEKNDQELRSLHEIQTLN